MEKDIKQPEAQMEGIGQQLRYPLDYVTQEIIKSVARPGIAVNGIYISTDNVNPSSVLGYGTWEAFGTGRTLVGYDSGQTEFDTAGETGGSKTHTLTIAEMPSHDHTTVIQGGATGNLAGGNVYQSGGTTGSTGGGGSHNNLQPYIVVFFWKRTA